MRTTQIELEAARDKLYARIGNDTGITYVSVGRGELRVGYRAHDCNTIIPHSVDGVLVRTVRTSGIASPP